MTPAKPTLAIIVFFQQMVHFGLLIYVQVAALNDAYFLIYYQKTRHMTIVLRSSSNTRKFLLFFQEAEGDEVDSDREDQGNAAVKVMCRLCLSGENEGSSKAAKMLPCKQCNKKYHKKCLKNWGDHRGDFKNSSGCPLKHILSFISFDNFCSI